MPSYRYLPIQHSRSAYPKPIDVHDAIAAAVEDAERDGAEIIQVVVIPRNEIDSDVGLLIKGRPKEG